MPDRTDFDYSFGHYADLVDGLLEQLGVSFYALYVMDYGAPVGYRLALKHPDRVSASSFRTATPMRTGCRSSGIRSRPTGPTARRRIAGAPCRPLRRSRRVSVRRWRGDLSRIDPDNWAHDQALLDRPGNRRHPARPVPRLSNQLPLYPAIQAFFRKYQPPTLIVWGRTISSSPPRRALVSARSTGCGIASASTPATSRSRTRATRSPR